MLCAGTVKAHTLPAQCSCTMCGTRCRLLVLQQACCSRTIHRVSTSGAVLTSDLPMQLVPCPPPWKPGEVLDILCSKWRSDFQSLAGPNMGKQRECEEDILGLKRQYLSRSKGRRKWADLAERLLQLLHLFVSNLPAKKRSSGAAGILSLLQHDAVSCCCAKLSAQEAAHAFPRTSELRDLRISWSARCSARCMQASWWNMQAWQSGHRNFNICCCADRVPMAVLQRRLVTAAAQLERSLQHKRPPSVPADGQQPRHYGAPVPDMQRLADTIERISRQHQPADGPLDQYQQAGMPASQLRGQHPASLGVRRAPSLEQSWALQQLQQAASATQGLSAFSGSGAPGQGHRAWAQQHPMLHASGAQQHHWQQQQQQQQQPPPGNHATSMRMHSIPPELQDVYMHRMAMLQQQQQHRHPDISSVQTSAQHTVPSPAAQAYPPQRHSQGASGTPSHPTHSGHSQGQPESPHLSALLQRHSSLHSTGSGSIAAGMTPHSLDSRAWMPPGLAPSHAALSMASQDYPHR